MQKGQNNPSVTRLTALWALSESGLGGFMHALKIPFTGFFLGGFAIVIITLLAHHSTNRFKTIMQATILVILVKATVSPHSPPPAYIAVSFQGVAGALILGLMPLSRVSAALFGMIALFESAVQKFLVLTLLYGNNLWEALDLFFTSITKDLPLQNVSFSFIIIGVYTTIYTVWGLLLGFWSAGLPLLIRQRSHEVIHLYYNIGDYEKIAPQKKKRNKLAKKFVSVFVVLLFIASVFVFAGEKGMAVNALLRTIAALLILFFVLNPLVKMLMAYWAKKKKNDTQLTSLLDHLPQMRNYISPAMSIAREQNKGLAVYRSFVINLIILGLKNPTAKTDQ